MGVLLKSYWRRAVEAACSWVAWHLPRRVVYHTVIRATAAASTSPAYENTVVGSLTAFQVMGHWE